MAARDRASLEVYFGKDNVMQVDTANPDNVLVIVDKRKEKHVWVRPSNASEGLTQYALYKKA